MLCPNTSSKEWEALVEHYGGNEKGEFEAYRHWIANDRKLVGVPNLTLTKSSDTRVINALQERFKAVGSKVDVIVNPHLPAHKTADVLKQSSGEKDALIQINPAAILDPAEPISHEFSHVFIDVLGGMSNPRLRAARARLKGSEIEREILEKYPDKQGEVYDKEVLATAMGRESKQFWSDKAKNNSVLNSLRAIFRDIARIFGINLDTAQSLAKEMLTDTLNNYEATGKMEEYSYDLRKKLTKEEEVLDKAIGILSSQINVMSRDISEKTPAARKSFAKLKELLVKLGTGVKEQSMLEFYSRAETQLEQSRATIENLRAELNKKPEDRTKNKNGYPMSVEEIISTLSYVNQFIRSFDMEILRDMKEIIVKKFPDRASLLDKVITEKGNLDAEFSSTVKQALVEKIDPQFENVDAWFRREAEIEYNKANPKYKYTEEEKAEREKFIEKYMQDHTQERVKEMQYRKDRMLDWVEKDINLADAFLNNPKDTNNLIISEVDKLLNKVEMTIQHQTMNTTKIAEATYKQFTEYFGKKSDPVKQWEPFLELDKDGNFTGYLIASRSAKERAILEGKYKGTPVEDMYNLITKLVEERDSYLPAKKRLDRKLPSINKSFFEAVAGKDFLQTTWARIGDAFQRRAEETEFGDQENEVSKLTTNIRDIYDRTINVIVGKDNKERQFVPVNFRGEMDPKDQSADVLSSLILDYHQAVNYKHKRSIAPTVELLVDVAEDVKVESRHGLLNLLKIRAGSKQAAAQKPKEDVNFLKTLNSMVESRLYGVLSAGSPEAHKIASMLRSYSSNVNLIGNYYSAGANLTQGSAMNWLEAAGGRFYGFKDLAQAHAKRDLDLNNIMVDVTRRSKLSKTELLKEFFDVQNNWMPLDTRFAENNALKRHANIGTGHTFNQMAEYAVQTVSMYATLNNIKVKDKNGKYLNKKGEVVKTRDEAMSLDEAFEVGFVAKDGKTTISKDDHRKLSPKVQKTYTYGVLHLNPKVASTDRADGVVDVDSIVKVSEILRKVSRDLYGNYSAKNKAALERYAVGSLVTHMRKWFVPGIKKRFRGGATLFRRDGEKLMDLAVIRNDELNELNMYYDKNADQHSEGMYISSLRYIMSTIADMKGMQAGLLGYINIANPVAGMKSGRDNWAKLSESERQNVHRTVAEMAIAALSYISFLMLSAAMDDDDDEMIAMAAFFSRRLQGELLTYLNPMELNRTLRTPAVSLSILQTSTKALTQLFSPFEEDRQGNNKLQKSLFKLIPGQAAFKQTIDLLNFYANPR